MEERNRANKFVLIATQIHPILADGLKALGFEPILDEQMNRKTALEKVGFCEGIITSTKLNIDRDLIDSAPQLKWIARMGSGMEIVDTEYAAKRGIECISSPEGNRNAVGEHALGMLLALTKKIILGHNEMIAGHWRREPNRGIELEGKTIGIIGFGNAGSAFAKKLLGFDMEILAYDKMEVSNKPKQVSQVKNLEKIYKEADIVSFHLPLQADTVHYFNEEFLNNMCKNFILINTSRGSVVDTAVLVSGLKSGKIIGACLDVFEQEPPIGSKSAGNSAFEHLLNRPQVILTPHIAGYSHEAIYKMSKVLLEKISGFREML